MVEGRRKTSLLRFARLRYWLRILDVPKPAAIAARSHIISLTMCVRGLAPMSQASIGLARSNRLAKESRAEKAVAGDATPRALRNGSIQS